MCILDTDYGIRRRISWGACLLATRCLYRFNATVTQIEPLGSISRDFHFLPFSWMLTSIRRTCCDLWAFMAAIFVWAGTESAFCMNGNRARTQTHARRTHDKSRTQTKINLLKKCSTTWCSTSSLHQCGGCALHGQPDNEAHSVRRSLGESAFPWIGKRSEHVAAEVFAAFE